MATFLKINESLVFLDTVTAIPPTYDNVARVTEHLQITEKAMIYVGARDIVITETLNISEKMYNSRPISITETLNISHGMGGSSKKFIIIENPNMTESLVFRKNNTISHVLVGQSLSFIIDRVVNLSENLNIGENLSIIKAKVVNNKVIILGNCGVTLNDVTIGNDDYTLELKKPAYGNIIEYNKRVIVRTTRAGELDIGTVNDWPDWYKINYTFDNLCVTAIPDLKQFLKDTVALKLILNAYDGFDYEGFIMNPEAPITQNNRGSYEWSFEFIGKRLP